MSTINPYRYVKAERTLVPNVQHPQWKCHTPNLLAEVLNNPGTSALRQPMRILGELLHAVAERASQINDPALNILMLRLTLYELADPAKHSADEIEEAFAGQRAALYIQHRDETRALELRDERGD